MSFTVPAEEPPVEQWQVATVPDLVARLLPPEPPLDRPVFIAVDGRSAAGKSTLTDRIHRQVPRSAIVHTDDVAWHEPYFAWGRLMHDAILQPLRQGRAVDFAPPQWVARGRSGTIAVAAGLDLVLVEGVGANQLAFADTLDATIWVQSDFAEAERRGIIRDIALGVNGDHDASVSFWHQWMAEELPYLARERPWERADLIVAGTPPPGLGEDAVALSVGPLHPR